MANRERVGEIASHEDIYGEAPYETPGPHRSWDDPQLPLFNARVNPPHLANKFYGTPSARDARNPVPRKQPSFENEPLPFHESDQHLTTPSDPVLHKLRQQNPHLNDYQFFGANMGAISELYAKHNDNINRPSEGELRWAGHDGFRDSGPYEVDMVKVDREHRGKGLATALWDYAHMSQQFAANRPQHSEHRSDAGDGWAKHVGGEVPIRKRGHGITEYS